ncbi:hypothetical protein [Limosilactobacillus agrestis]|uniref:hypothetical protein n=1 Tax=Limosilactobacillus agrestis TaxID=2759748 RepID=UPI001E508D78|nr:hypothetical protein [Limosilactobacillus agrestis]MCD7112266.1 hypothetical protein [Limosilactobacillus agrestis]
MTKSKYANKTVEIIDEDGNRMRMNYIDAVDQNYISLKNLAKELDVTPRMLTRQINSKKYDSIFRRLFKESLNHDPELGDFIGYPSQGKPKYVSKQLSAVIRDWQNGGISKYLGEKEEKINKIKKRMDDGSKSEIMSFLGEGLEYSAKIKNDLSELKRNISEQEKQYINYYRRTFINEVLGIINKKDSPDKKIQKIVEIGNKKQRVKNSNDLEESFEKLNSDVDALLFDYRILTIKPDENGPGLYQPFVSYVKRMEIEEKEEELWKKENPDRLPAKNTIKGLSKERFINLNDKFVRIVGWA